MRRMILFCLLVVLSCCGLGCHHHRHRIGSQPVQMSSVHAPQAVAATV